MFNYTGSDSDEAPKLVSTTQNNGTFTLYDFVLHDSNFDIGQQPITTTITANSTNPSNITNTFSFSSTIPNESPAIHLSTDNSTNTLKHGRYVVFVNQNTGNSYLYNADTGVLFATEISDTGGAYIINPSGTTKLIVQNPTPDNSENFGDDVYSFGNDIMIGVPRDRISGTASGAVYIFDGSTTGTTSTPKTEIRHPNPNECCGGDVIGGDRFGQSVATFTDGSKIIVGAPGDDHNDSTGSVYIFNNALGVITSPALEINSPDGAGRNFGMSVAVLGDKILVGAPSTSGGGTVYVFDGTMTGTTKIPILAIRNPDSDSGDGFGTAIGTMGTDKNIGRCATR